MSTSGVLFAALDYDNQDVVSALLHSGYIIFARQCGYGNIVEIFRKRLDPLRWHRVGYPSITNCDCLMMLID